MKRQNDISLINQVVDRSNMERTIEKVCKNKGAPGIDGVTVGWINYYKIG